MIEILFRGFCPDEDGKEKVFVNGEWVKGTWVYGFYVHYDDVVDCHLDDCDYIVERHNGKDFIFNEVITETVGQYVGLTDKNGTRIFEGDIIKGKHNWNNWIGRFGDDEKIFLNQKIRGAYGKQIIKSEDLIFETKYYYFRNYAVEYYTPNCGFRARNGGQIHKITKYSILNRNFEIIGNIFENPELLEER